MPGRTSEAPESSAVRVALWRALHVRVDSAPHEAGFRDVVHVAAAELSRRYFTGRADGLRLCAAEELLVATV